MEILLNPDTRYLEQLQRMLYTEPDLGIVELEYKFGANYFVAVEGDAPLGVATVVQWFDGSVELYKLYVAPTHRSKGIGMQLVNRVISELASHDVQEFVIEIAGDSAKFWTQVAKDRKIQDYGEGRYGIFIS
ncbi:GNAT family N-acetyltransferase [Burkholderia cepacia]|jgi:GNAT superfamily N-acetyltransferase|uniref:GNAT family N-acetyltransferase n=1 Tax=Burkholderia cepacia TaxID=292 RepID=UPI000CF0C415|nr:GNAT family N-acetyltransferase [Burkholderia cepacia]KAB1587912.1 GNAT family N-acetyltransferase [Burkholderia cepacia]